MPRLPDTPTSGAATFRAALAEAGEVIPKGVEVSTVQAAKALGVSRPHLVKLLDKGAIEFRTVGTHRRVDVASLEEYRRHEQNEQTRHRRAAVASAVGSTEAEGLRVGADTTADLAAYADGKLDTAALRARALARYPRKAAE